ncbi:MAG: hypothetical protein ACKVTZ_14115 [Bacteroidia bacterium]
MKHLFTFLLMLLTGLGMIAQPPAVGTQTLEGLQHPESALAEGGFIYVSNVGNELKPEAKDNDGYISKYTRTGQLVEQRFIRNLNAPKGMVIVKSILYIADVDKIVAYSLLSKRAMTPISFEGLTTFLNDITVKDDTSLLVSATDAGKVYKVNLVTQKISEYAKGVIIQGINGLDYDAKSKVLYVSSMGVNGVPNGEIGKIIFNKVYRYERIGSDNGMFDGIKLFNDDLYYTDWRSMEKGGVLKKFSLISKQSTTILEGEVSEKGGLEKKKLEPLMGCADFCIDAKTKIMYIPLMLIGKVISHQL